MATYPLTPSQMTAATAEELLAFIKSPHLVARRFAEIGGPPIRVRPVGLNR